MDRSLLSLAWKRLSLTVLCTKDAPPPNGEDYFTLRGRCCSEETPNIDEVRHILTCGDFALQTLLWIYGCRVSVIITVFTLGRGCVPPRCKWAPSDGSGTSFPASFASQWHPLPQPCGLAVRGHGYNPRDALAETLQ